MAFRVVTAEPSTSAGFAVSSAFMTEDAALGFARDLIEDSVEVLRIEDDAGTPVLDADEVKAWCAARKRQRSGP